MFFLAENCAIQNSEFLTSERSNPSRMELFRFGKRSATFDYTVPWHPGSEGDVQNWHPLIFVRLATWIAIKEIYEERA